MKNNVKIRVEKSDKTSHNQRYHISEEGKSNFVEDKSLVNPILESFQKRKLEFPTVFGVPRSGSTLVRNILNTIFDGNIAVQQHGTMKVRDRDMIVATYRDFRDCAVSKWRMNNAGFDREKDRIIGRWDGGSAIVPKHMESIVTGKEKSVGIGTSAGAIRTRVKHLDRLDGAHGNHDLGFPPPGYRDKNHMKVNKNIYFARYEQFNDNFELLFNHFEEFFQIVIVKDLREFIQNTWNKDRVKRVYSDSLGAFEGYDRETEIHGQHIYKGKTGTWKEILHEDDHNKMTNLFKENLSHWGYTN